MYEIELGCGHTKEYTLKRTLPRKGNQVVCLRHESLKVATVIKVHRGWTVQCKYPGCTFFKDYALRDYLISISRDHLSKFPEHIILVWCAGSRESATKTIVRPRERVVQGEFPF
jgi:hypothetical protein